MQQPNRFDRRAALKAGVAGSLAAALVRTSFGASPAWMAGSPHKLLTIFLRGGYDANSAVIPHGDPTYTSVNRRSTFIPQANSIAINGLNPLSMGLNPALAPIAPLVNAATPRMVFLHATGNIARTGSHFDDQRTWDTATTQCSIPPLFDIEEGWITRVVSEIFGVGFHAASVSESMQQMYRTRLRPNNTFTASRVVPHIRALRDYPNDAVSQFTLDTIFPTLDNKLVGNAAPPSGLRALFSGGAGKDAFARAVGSQMLESAEAVAQFVPTPYLPLGGALYPFGKPQTPPNPYPTPANAGLLWDIELIRRFFMNLRDAMALLRHVPDVNVAGIELGGFDTHSNQGGWNTTTNQIEGQLAGLLNAVAFGIASVDAEASAGAFGPNGSITVLVVSEFGRTSAANTSEGTDHGAASCVWVGNFGTGATRVRTSLTSGAVFNTAATEWPGLFSANDQTFGCPGNPSAPPPHQFMKIATDFRAVYARILRTLYSATPAQIDQVIPGYSSLTGTTAVEPAFIV